MDHKYVANIIEKADSGFRIPEYTIVSDIINTIDQDWARIVNHNHAKKNNHGLISVYSQKSTKLVINHSHSFIKENARNIIPKLRKNLLIDTILDQLEKKFSHNAHTNIRGNAIFATSKLKPIIPKIDVVIQVPTFDHRITASADVRDKIHVQTKAKTNTETTFELSNIIVINIQLQNDFNMEDVNLFNKFLNHQFVSEETACSK